MIYLNKEDFYEVYLNSIISDFDHDTLTMLYQPIIGSVAVSLYLTLYGDFKKKSDIATLEELLCEMGIDITSLTSAKAKLEGIGLIRTYYKKDKEQSFFKFVLYAPKTPKEFFDDILLKGLLIQKIGEKKVQQYLRRYKTKKLDLEGYNEISASYKDVYKTDMNYDDYSSTLNIVGGYGRKVIDVSKGFDNTKFLSYLENLNILSKSIKKSDMKKISEIALLYGVNEEIIADYVSQCYLPEEKDKIDYDRLKDLCIKDKSYQVLRKNGSNNIAYDSTSKIGKKIEIMQTYSALDYLKLKQNNGAVSPSDVKLITELNESYGLNSSVINVLIDYCLERNNNQLSRTYVTKIAASINREGITSTLDAMNYLKQNNRRKKQDYQNDNSSNNDSESENISKEDLSSLIEGL
jgi:replication initiation and membrane attachment protein